MHACMHACSIAICCILYSGLYKIIHFSILNECNIEIQLVVANLLETRRTSVTLVCVENQETVTMKLSTATKVSGICAVRELEDSIVSEIVQKHSFFLA